MTVDNVLRGDPFNFTFISLKKASIALTQDISNITEVDFACHSLTEVNQMTCGTGADVIDFPFP